MKKINLLVLLLFCSISFSQVTFEKGYVVDNGGIRSECYIKNYDWKNNPTSIEYKSSLDDKVREGSVKEIAEFGIDNFSKYVRAYVDVDRASTSNLASSRIPEYKSETLFLKVLKEANVSLYSYSDGSLNLYFIKTNGGKIEQLINKPYRISELQTGFYQYYKQQLSNAMDCGDIKKTIESASYNKSGLEDVFQKYYTCSSQTETVINKNKPKSEINFSIKPGISVISFAMDRRGTLAGDVDFGSKVCGRIGAELEIIFPFNKGKWSLFVEPNYSSFSSSKKIPSYNLVTVESKMFNMPIGIRHYMFINNKSKLFLNFALNLGLSSKANVAYQNGEKDVVVKLGGGFIGGIGFKYKKYSVEARGVMLSDPATNYSDLSAKSSSYGLIFGYEVF